MGIVWTSGKGGVNMSTVIDYDVTKNDIDIKDIELFIKLQMNDQWSYHYERMKDYISMSRMLRNMMFAEYGELSKIEEVIKVEKRNNVTI